MDKPLKILFVASDPGGARAILPVFDTLYENNIQFMVVENGYLHSEASNKVLRVSKNAVCTYGNFSETVNNESINLVCFGTGVHDEFPLEVAHHAKLLGIPTISILDNWMNYRQRLICDRYGLVLPTIYVVMDEYARSSAIKDDIPESVIRVTGHPGLKDFEQLAKNFSLYEKDKISLDSKKKHILFVSEPAEDDHGHSKNNPLYRGYTESTVLEKLSLALQIYSNDIQLDLLSHPRENRNKLSTLWDRVKGRLEGTVLEAPDSRDALFRSDAVVGMTSILLYESWLLGKPTLSLQPGLIRYELDIFSDRDGCESIISEDCHQNKLDAWVNKVLFMDEPVPRNELSIHSNSLELVVAVMDELLNDAGSGKVK